MHRQVNFLLVTGLCFRRWFVIYECFQLVSVVLWSSVDSICPALLRLLAGGVYTLECIVVLC